MPSTPHRTVVFADLRGSTALYGSLGNAQAASVVTRTVSLLAQVVEANAGRLVKTLGDGLMAQFDKPVRGVRAAYEMLESIARITSQAQAGAAALKLHVSVAHGEIVEVGGDCFGDAVNVAARLLDHAGDNEVLITQEVYVHLSRGDQQRLRSLERLHLRGRTEPCHVYLLDAGQSDGEPSTLFTDFNDPPVADGLRLSLGTAVRVITAHDTPLVIGRSPEAHLCVEDSRVSRLHARIEWHGGNFHLVDQSSNGSFVRFAQAGEIVVLRRGSCMLHGSGVIGMGAAPTDPRAACLQFEVIADAPPLSGLPG